LYRTVQTSGRRFVNLPVNRLLNSLEIDADIPGGGDAAELRIQEPQILELPKQPILGSPRDTKGPVEKLGCATDPTILGHAASEIGEGLGKAGGLERHDSEIVPKEQEIIPGLGTPPQIPLVVVAGTWTFGARVATMLHHSLLFRGCHPITSFGH
jgi:hypothetical protein